MVVFLLLFAIVVPLLSIAAVVLTFIASWKVHEKAGLPGWSGIIPYYNYYARAEKIGMKDTFWKCLKLIAVTFGVGFVGSFLIAIIAGIAAIGSGLATMSESTGALVGAMSGGAIITILLSFLVAIASGVFMIWALIQLVKIDIEFVSHFGKTTGFAIGMLFLPFVFYPILAWGQATWDENSVIDVDNAPITQQ